MINYIFKKVNQALTPKMSETWNLHNAHCRCCHAYGTFKSLNIPNMFMGEMEIYSDMLKETFGFHLHLLSLDVNNTICDGCVAELRAAARFKKQVQACENNFVEYCKKKDFKYKAKKTIEDKPEKRNENYLEYANGKVFNTNTVKKENEKKERDNKQQESYQCQICEKNYSTLQKMLNHKHRQHQKKSLFVCDMCQKEFLHKNSLQKHIGWHSGTNKKFMCEICGYSFHDKTNLNVHFRAVHQKLKLYKCTLCPKKFAANKNLKIHFRLHSGERPYTCDVCHEGFICSTYLVKHKEKHDNIKKFGGKYICKVCTAVFNERHVFTAHMRSHVGVKPYRCSYCEKDFFSRFSLKRHNENQHTRDVRFGCKNCDAIFSDKSKLQVHFENLHETKELKCDQQSININIKNNITIKGCRHEIDKRSKKNKIRSIV